MCEALETENNEIFYKGDRIVYKGDVGREMYIIRRGLVEVLSKNQLYSISTLGPGGYFGEVGNLYYISVVVFRLKLL